jgi:hypothetical protein
MHAHDNRRRPADPVVTFAAGVEYSRRGTVRGQPAVMRGCRISSRAARSAATERHEIIGRSSSRTQVKISTAFVGGPWNSRRRLGTSVRHTVRASASRPCRPRAVVRPEAPSHLTEATTTTSAGFARDLAAERRGTRGRGCSRCAPQPRRALPAPREEAHDRGARVARVPPPRA